MKNIDNKYDVLTTLAGVIRFPGENNLSLLHKASVVNAKHPSASLEFISHYFAGHIDSKLQSLPRSSYIFTLSENPIKEYATDGSLIIPSVELDDYYVDVRKVPGDTLPGVMEYDTGLAAIIFSLSDTELAPYIMLLTDDTIADSTLKVTYKSSTGLKTEAFSIVSEISVGDLIVLDLARSSHIERLYKEGIVPNSLGYDLLSFVETYARTSWGSNVALTFTPRFLGSSYPSHFDARIEHTDYVSDQVYDDDETTVFRSGVQWGSFQVKDVIYSSNYVEIVCTPGLITYRNIPIFVGVSDVYVSNPGDSFLDVTLVDGFPIDIIYTKANNMMGFCSIPTDIFYISDIDTWNSTFGCEWCGDDYDINNLDDRIRCYIEHCCTPSAETLTLGPGFVGCRTDGGLVVDELLSVGVPLDIHTDECQYKSIFSRHWNYHTHGNKLAIEIPEDERDESLVFFVLRPADVHFRVPLEMFHTAAFTDFFLGLGVKRLTGESDRYAPDITDFEIFVTGYNLEALDMLLIPYTSYGLVPVGCSVTVSVDSGTITDPAHCEPSTTITTTIPQSGAIHLTYYPEESTTSFQVTVNGEISKRINL